MMHSTYIIPEILKEHFGLNFLISVKVFLETPVLVN